MQLDVSAFVLLCVCFKVPSASYYLLSFIFVAGIDVCPSTAEFFCLDIESRGTVLPRGHRRQKTTAKTYLFSSDAGLFGSIELCEELRS
jgi:hypothetical protein